MSMSLPERLLVPLIIGMTASSRMEELIATARRAPLPATLLCPGRPAIGEAAVALLTATGVLDTTATLTEVGARVLERGPGPFGIIEAYRTYLDALPEIWRGGRGTVHVERAANVAASQAANAKSFSDANDALDRFCQDTGFGFRSRALPPRRGPSAPSAPATCDSNATAVADAPCIRTLRRAATTPPSA